MKKHLFFDLDRTLWDFETNSKKALQHLFEELNLGKNIKKFDHFYNAYKQKNATLWYQYGRKEISKDFLRTERFAATLRQFNIKNEQLTNQLSDGYVDLSPYQTVLFPNTIETLNLLKEADYQMHIITNGFKEVQHIKLSNSGLTPYFDIILCSEEVGHNKPSPHIFYHALKVSGAKSENSVMIGDDPEIDVYGAINCGIKGVLFDPNDEHHKYDELTRIANLSELPEVLHLK